MLYILENWMWSFLGIVIESLPFILIGSIISALIQNYVSEDGINKIIPKNRFVGILFASLAGLVLPLCECAIVPISRSLIKKGLPVGIGITFMLAVPIVNPVVIMSTYYAFPNNLNIVFIRTVGGIVAAIIIGLIMDKLYKNKDIIKKDNKSLSRCECCNVDMYRGNNRFNKFSQLVNHGSSEFLNISKYFVIGAFLSSVFSIFYDTLNISNYIPNKHIGIIFMMFLGFLLSLCSEADAFIAKGFLQSFGVEAVIAFLILGPMMDLKNALLAFGVFKKRFVITLFIVINIVVFIFALTIGYFI